MSKMNILKRVFIGFLVIFLGLWNACYAAAHYTKLFKAQFIGKQWPPRNLPLRRLQKKDLGKVSKPQRNSGVRYSSLGKYLRTSCTDIVGRVKKIQNSPTASSVFSQLSNTQRGLITDMFNSNCENHILGRQHIEYAIQKVGSVINQENQIEEGLNFLQTTFDQEQRFFEEGKRNIVYHAMPADIYAALFLATKLSQSDHVDSHFLQLRTQHSKFAEKILTDYYGSTQRDEVNDEEEKFQDVLLSCSSHLFGGVHASGESALGWFHIPLVAGPRKFYYDFLTSEDLGIPDEIIMEYENRISKVVYDFFDTVSSNNQTRKILLQISVPDELLNKVAAITYPYGVKAIAYEKDTNRLLPNVQSIVDVMRENPFNLVCPDYNINNFQYRLVANKSLLDENNGLEVYPWAADQKALNAMQKGLSDIARDIKKYRN